MNCAICGEHLKIVDGIFYLEKVYVEIDDKEVRYFHKDCLIKNIDRLKPNSIIQIMRTWEGTKKMIEAGSDYSSKKVVREYDFNKEAV